MLAPSTWQPIVDSRALAPDENNNNEEELIVWIHSYASDYFICNIFM